MSDLESRLAECFARVFPELPPGRLPKASTHNVYNWDSLHTITLVAVIEEQFGLQISAEELPELTSFERARSYLERACANL